MVQRRPTNRFVRHLLFWAGVNLFFFVGFFTQPEVYSFDPIPFLIELFFASLLTFLFYTYILIYGLLPLLFRGTYGWFAVGVLCLNIVASMLYGALGYVQQFVQRWIDDDPSRLVNSIVFTNPFLGPLFVEINLVAGVMAGIKLFDQWQQKQAESQRLEREKLQNELQLLKTQINPDLLFASLNELAVLIRQKSKQAPELVLKLAHLLRYVLYESQANTVPLGRELDVIDDYVFLQRIIHVKFIEVSFTVRGTVKNQRIAPLSLFPIIENTFRQLPAELAEPTWVSVDLAIDETQVSLKVVSELTYPPTDGDNTPTNLDGLQKQLAFYYPDNHSIKIWQEGRINVVILTISFPTNSLETKPVSAQPIGSPT